jgi:hypothetical protein
MASGAHRVGSAAISILVNVEGVLLAGSQSLDFGRDFHGVALLREANFAFAFVPGRGMQDSYRLLNRSRAFRCGRRKSRAKAKNGNGGQGQECI